MKGSLLKLLAFFFLTFIVGIAIPKLTVHDLVELSAEEKQCVEITTRQFFDHPLERVALALGKSAATGEQGNNSIKDKTIIVKSYTIFRIPLPTARLFNRFTQHVICDWATEKITRNND